MPDPHARISLNVHNTPAPIIDALARLFTVESRDASRWVALDADGVTVTFFAEQVKPDDTTAA